MPRPSSMKPSDQVSRLTRVVAALIVPFLAVAFVMLYLFPARAVDWWAWPMRGRLSAFWMGAGYIAGAYFFVRAVLAQRWHHVAVGFLPVAVFATLLGLTTVLHWSSFSHERPAFAAWAFLYFTTPVLVPLVWWLNRPADAHAFDPQDAVLPGRVRQVMGLVSAGVVGAGLFLFLLPQVAAGFWPWAVTTMEARAMGAWFVLPGVFGLTISRERRWSAVRYAVQSQASGVALILLGVLLAWRDLDPANPLTWLLLVGMVGLLLGLGLLYAHFERRARAPVMALAQT